MRLKGKHLFAALTVAVAVLVGGSMAGAGNAVRPGGTAGGSAGEPATVITGACLVAGANFVTADNTGLSTTSTTMVDVPDMSITYTQGKTGCVLASFSAYTFARDDALLYVQAILDGVTVAAPGEVQLSGDDDEEADGHWARSHSFTFAFSSVSAGSHTIKVQYRSFDGKVVFVHKRSLVVSHK